MPMASGDPKHPSYAVNGVYTVILTAQKGEKSYSN